MKALTLKMCLLSLAEHFNTDIKYVRTCTQSPTAGFFWHGLGLSSQRPMLSYQKINPCQNIYGKNE